MNILRVIPCLILTLSVLGCAGAPKAIKAWQASVQTYVAEQGDGDLNALRNVSERPSQRKFGLLRADTGGVPVLLPSHSDVQAVLLGRRLIEGRDWFVFLVGTLHYDQQYDNIPLDDPKLRDIRVVTLSTDHGKLKWVVGRGDSKALLRYLQHKRETWRWQHPGSDADEVVLSGFPAPQDNFKLSIFASGVTVVDAPSGAHWALAIPSR